MKRIVLLMLMVLCSLTVYGQQAPNGGSPCPPGMVPGYGTCYSPSDPARYGGEPQAPSLAGPLWQDRFGAFAVDSTTGSYGYASGVSNKKAAFKAAIDDCGGGGCEVVSWARNGCLVAVSGGSSSYAVRADLKQAETAAMDRCSKNGADSACKIIYSACSLPVRVR